MKQARRNRKINTPDNLLIKHSLREIVLISFCFIGLYLFASLATYTPLDPGWWRTGSVEEINNKGGLAGAMFSDFFFFLFGYFAYLFPVMIAHLGLVIYRGHHRAILAEPKNLITPTVGFVLTLSAGCGLAIVHFAAESTILPSHAGGILGIMVGKSLQGIFSQLGATLLLLALFFTGVTLLTGLSWLKLMDVLGFYTLRWLPIVEKYLEKHTFPWLIEHIKQLLKFIVNILTGLFNGIKNAIIAWRERRKVDYEDDFDEEEHDYFDEGEKELISPAPNEKEAVVLKEKTPKISASQEGEIEPIEEEKVVEKVFELPALSLLNPVLNKRAPEDTDKLSEWMLEGLHSLQIQAEIKAVNAGPRLTSFDIQTVTHINVNHLDELSEALMQVLKVEHLNTVEIVPGILGIETSNPERQTVFLRELLSTPEYQDNDSKLTIALGKDVTGNPVIGNLTRIPHILMAGSNVAEKNMAINILLLSLLYKSTPSDLRLLLVNSSSAELSIYANLPHLLTPIVDDMVEVPNMLQWCVHEMERRYRIMGEMGVHSIEEYNENLQNPTRHSFFDISDAEPMFYIVIVIHEIEELTGETNEQSEKFIVNLVQKSRASGIYLILATQHPTIHVITGLLKTNIPTRLAFQVNNKSESRAILGQVGAENLLGEGDMLYMTAGTTTPVRVHSSFVTKHEVEKVVADLKTRDKPDYINLN